MEVWKEIGTALSHKGKAVSRMYKFGGGSTAL